MTASSQRSPPWPLLALTHLQYDYLASTEVTLAWPDSGDDGHGFVIEKSPDGTTFVEVGAAAAHECMYWVGELTPGTTYTLRVYSEDWDGVAGYCETVAMTTPVTAPDAPSGLLAMLTNDSQVELSWADASGDEAGFVIERSVDGGPYAELAMVGPSVSEYLTPAPPEGVSYSYQVYAYNATGVSAATQPTQPTTTPNGASIVIAFYGAGPKGPAAFGNYWFEWIAREVDRHLWLYNQDDMKKREPKSLKRFLDLIDEDGDQVITQAEINQAPTLRIIGYSWGGMAAVALTDLISVPRDHLFSPMINHEPLPGTGYTLEAAIPVRNLVTIDPVPICWSTSVRENVRCFSNYYQRRGGHSWMTVHDDSLPEPHLVGEWDMSTPFGRLITGRALSTRIPAVQERIDRWVGGIFHSVWPPGSREERRNPFLHGTLGGPQVNHDTAPWLVAPKAINDMSV